MKPWDLMKWAFTVELPPQGKVRESSMRSVLVNIVYHFNGKLKMAWPGVERIARETGLKEETVIKATGALERLGMISTERREGRHGYNRYRLGIISPTHSEVDQTPQNGVAKKNVESPFSSVEPPILAVDTPKKGVELQSSELQSKNNNPEHGGFSGDGNGRGNGKQYAKGSSINHKTRTRINLPEWLDGELWNAFIKHRKAMGRRMIPEAQESVIEELTKLREKGNDPTSVIKRSITQGWPGVYELKNGKKASGESEGPDPSMVIGTREWREREKQEKEERARRVARIRSSV